MNKQELINHIEEVKGDKPHYREQYHLGRWQAIEGVLELIDQLNETEITEEQAWQKIAESTNLTVERLKMMSVDQSQLEALQSESKRCSGMELAELLSIVENNGFNEPIKSDKSIKRDDVLDRLQEIGEHNRNEWIEVILRVFGDDYGTAKYREGYEQGVLNGILTSNKNKLVEIPQFVAETIEKYKKNDNSLGELLASVEHANIKYYHGMEKHRVNFDNLYEPVVDLCAIIASAWLYGYTIEPPKTLQVIVKNYDSTVYKTELPEDEAMKLIEGWKEDAE